MAHIFISYRRADAGYVANVLGERIRDAFGESSVFIDVDTIPLGIDFREHINKAVSECDVLLAIIGDKWLTLQDAAGQRRIDEPADFVRIEIEAAIKRNIPVVPILIDNATMPAPAALPESIRQLAFRNAAELRAGRDMNHHIDLLIRNLRTHVVSAQTVTSGSAGSAVSSRRSASESKLRFLRGTRWVGRFVPFKIEVDGKLVGELGAEESLEVPVEPGRHRVHVSGAGTLYGTDEDVSISAGQELTWEVGYSLTGGVKLTDA